MEKSKANKKAKLEDGRTISPVNINYPELLEKKCKEEKVRRSPSVTPSNTSEEKVEEEEIEEAEVTEMESSEDDEFDGKDVGYIESKDTDVLAGMMDLKSDEMSSNDILVQ